MSSPPVSTAFAYEALARWASDMLVARGLPVSDAGIVAEGLLDADLREVPTHGVAQLPVYLSLIDKGVTNPRPDIRVSGRSGLLRIDADRALGQVATIRAMEALEPKARELGMAGAAIAQAGHLGALGYFARRAAEAGLVAIVLQNGPPLMGMPGSTARAIGNNPLAFGAPVPGGAPIVLDISTSAAAYGKILTARTEGRSIPADWALDSKGQPTTDPAVAADGIMLPLAGAKGIGLAMMVEVLAGSLSGTRPVFGGNLFGGFVMLADPLAVSGPEAYGEHMTAWIVRYRASGADARYPGKRAAESRARQLDDGVALAASLVETLADIGDKAGIALPQPI